jgi:hypothetical protein
MANNPKKTIDPTEAALSAIQEALNIRDDEEPAAHPMDPVIEPRGGHDDERRVAAPPQPSFHDRFESDPIGTRDLGVQGRGAANDDRQSIGQILQALQRRPSRTSYFVAAIFSAAWAVGCLALSWAYLPDFYAAVGPGHSLAAIALGLGAAALLPIIFFFGVAHMAWRGQELRLIAQAMAGVAMRLAEPESVAQDSIVSVGQAIRREVAAMGDGVERALARASELETLVQNEVAALARTYGDNEARIRGLIQDLANQRDTLVGQAEQVRSAINNVHIDLTQDLSTISDLVGQQVNDAAQRITLSLAEKGEHITLSLGEVGDNMIQQLSVRGSDLLDRLENTSAETSRAIATASDRLTSSLSFKTDHIGEEFAEIAQGIEDMLTARLDSVTDGFSEKALATVDMMVSRSQELTDSIVDTSSQIAERIASSAEEVNSTLRTSGESLVLDLNLRGGELASKLEQAGTRITDAMVSRSNNMTDSVRESAEHLVSAITSRSDDMKEMLATRLAAYEDMFSHSGVELGEKISRDSETLGNLITRHLSEFDRTVKTYGSELVERLGARTQDVSESMRSYIDTFDNRVTARANEVTTSLDQRLSRFQETLDTRTEALTEALSTRVMDIAKTLAEGGKEVVTAVDKRVGDVANVIDSRGQMLAEMVGERVATIETTLGTGAKEVASALDDRITHLEQLLIGRTENVIREMDSHSRSAADLLNSRLVALSDAVKSNSAEAERSLTQLLATTTDSLGKSVAATAAVTEALNRSSAEATASLDRSTTTLNSTISKSAAAAIAAIDKTATTSSETLGKSAASLTETISRTTATASDLLGKSAASASDLVGKTAAAASSAITKSATTASETVKVTSTNATELMAQTARASSDAITRSAGDAQRTLVTTSADIARNLVGRADEIHAAVAQRVGDLTRTLDEKSGEMNRVLDERSTEISQILDAKSGDLNRILGERSGELNRVLGERSGELDRMLGERSGAISRVLDERSGEVSRVLDQKSSDLVAVLAGKGEQFAVEVGRVTDQAVKAIEAKGFVFTQTMMDNSEEIARLINEAGENATTAVTRTLSQFQEGTQGVADAAKTAITRTMQDLHNATRTAVEESKQTAAATVADMMETHGMLRTDSTALFERLREANILLQEVLSGAHENMNAIEHTMVSRVSEFVTAMNELNSKSGSATAKVEEHLGLFNRTTVSVLHDLSELATQFSTHGRSLAEAVELLERSNRRSEDSVASRHASIGALVATLDSRTDDFEQRLRRFSGLLDESLDSSTARARDIASIVAETSNESVHTIEQQYEIVRTAAEEQRKRTSDAVRAVYAESSGEAHAMFNQAAERFADIMQGMKQMAADMQRELEATRAELRRGVLELPQETADSAAQMRRVIVDQIEALAELNRIVARHGRALDAVEPVRREAEPAYAAGGGRAQPRPVRSEPPAGAPPRQNRDITGAPTRRSDAPSLSPIQGGKDAASNGRNGGWLSDLLTRASRDRDEAPPISPSNNRAPPRDSVGSLESLSVDIARMIDHEATVELWERYQRGERGVGERRLYTAQGQKAFEEIRNKYRSDPEFRQTVEHYIHEFERLLDDVSRGERGPTVARNYLTSDTGKVYTMLAHAAGRFE